VPPNIWKWLARPPGGDWKYPPGIWDLYSTHYIVVLPEPIPNTHYKTENIGKPMNDAEVKVGVVMVFFFFFAKKNVTINQIK
jgi:hypothetical protein